MTERAHWRDRAISASEAISDTFDVFKAYGAHLANWVLFLCLIANLIEMVSPAFRASAGLLIVGIQSITLDVAGFGLTAMAASARRRGDNKSALKADIMGWTLIAVMTITVALITVAAFDSDLAQFVQQADNALMLTRVIVTVFYGHIVHKLREEHTEHDKRVSSLEQEVSSLKRQLSTKEQEVSSVQSRLSSVQKALSSVQSELDSEREKLSNLQYHLSSEQQRVSSLEHELDTGHGDTVGLRRELDAARLDAESLRVRLDAKQREVDAMQADQAAVVTLRRELHTARLHAEDLQAQLNTKQREVSSLRRELSSVQQQVSSGRGVQVSSKQAERASSGQREVDSAGQGKVLQLDTSRPRKAGQDERVIEAQIRALLKEEPGLSGRAIAARLGCSPTTAAKWKNQIEQSA